MLRGSSLSDPKIIQRLNHDFVAVEINLTDTGFPKDAPGLALWEKAFNERKGSNQFGFATSIVLNAVGTKPFGSSGSGTLSELETAINYDPAKYLSFLEQSLARYRRAIEVANSGKLNAAEKESRLKEIDVETLLSIREANRGYLERK